MLYYDVCFNSLFLWCFPQKAPNPTASQWCSFVQGLCYTFLTHTQWSQKFLREAPE